MSDDSGDFCIVYLVEGGTMRAATSEHERLQGFLSIVHGMVNIQLADGDHVTIPMDEIRGVGMSTTEGRENANKFARELEKEEERGTWE